MNCRRRKPNGILGENTSAAAVVVLSLTFSTQCPAARRLSDLVGLICASDAPASDFKPQDAAAVADRF